MTDVKTIDLTLADAEALLYRELVGDLLSALDAWEKADDQPHGPRKQTFN